MRAPRLIWEYGKENEKKEKEEAVESGETVVAHLFNHYSIDEHNIFRNVG